MEEKNTEKKPIEKNKEPETTDPKPSIPEPNTEPTNSENTKENTGLDNPALLNYNNGPPTPKKKSNKKLYITLILLIVIILGGYGIFKMTGNAIQEDTDSTNTDTTIPGETGETGQTKVRLQTTMGNIIIKLYDDMPITTGNFKNLVEQGTYNEVIFHRVIPGFMIQGGDPTGTGMGDPSIPSIEDEFLEGHSNVRGTISMANAGPNTGSSQFFINIGDNINLDFNQPPEASKHPVFGEVTEGMEIVDRISQVPRDNRDKPRNPVRIIKAEIV